VIAALGRRARDGRTADRQGDVPRAGGRVRERTGARERLFHPIRLALTGEPEGLELDIAVPLIEQGAASATPRCAGVQRRGPRRRVPARARETGRQRVIIYGINPVIEA